MGQGTVREARSDAGDCLGDEITLELTFRVDGIEPMPDGKWLKVKLTPFDQTKIEFDTGEDGTGGDGLEPVIRCSRVIRFWRPSDHDSGDEVAAA
jgi:hypothetical protein